MNENKFDIIIVGAGPAGLRCGKILAENNFKILILEKNQKIGPKICGGAITANNTQLGLPDDLIEFKFYNHYIYLNDKLVKIHLNQPIMIVDRKNLGQWMSAEAHAAGCQILTGYRVEKIENNWVEVGNQRFYFEKLIGADGAKSLVRTSLRLKSQKMILALEYQTNQKFKEMRWYLKPNLFGPGYIWFFPHKCYTSIGVGALVHSHNFKNLKNNFDKFLKGLGINVSPLSCKSALVNYDFQGYQFGDKFLIGEAAGLSSGLTGEGIYPAIISGEEIAKMIINPSYEPTRLNQLIKEKGRQERLLSIFQKAGFLQNSLFKIFFILIQKQNFRHFLKNKFYSAHF